MNEVNNPETLPRLSVVVITRNRCESLARTLASLARLEHASYEVIVVDNASTDQTRETAEAAGARYVFSPAAAGISGTRQLGVDASRGEIVAMCDDDCVPDPNWLKHFERAFAAHPNVALIGGRVVNVGFPGLRQYKGTTKLTANGELEFAETAAEADFFGNLNMALRCSAVEEVGGYDPFLKAGLEEIDLAMTLRRHGYGVAYEPQARVHHYFLGVNYKRGRVFFDKHLMRLYFYFKHFRPRAASAWLRFVVAEARLTSRDVYRAVRAVVSAILRRRPDRLRLATLDLFNAITARLAIPWLLWRSQAPDAPLDGWTALAWGHSPGTVESASGAPSSSAGPE